MTAVTVKTPLLKQPRENKPYTFNFRPLLNLDEDETISTAVLTVTVDDDSPTAEASVTLATGAATFDDDNEKVIVRMSEGTDNVDYRLQCDVTTSEGNTHSMDAILQVRDE